MDNSTLGLLSSDLERTLEEDFALEFPDGLPDFPEDRISDPIARSARTPAKRKTTNQWDPRMILDLAIAIDDLPVILDRYNVSMDEFETLSEVRSFRQDLASTMKDVRENGVSFRRKAGVQAESYLEVLDSMVYADDTPASVRLETIRSAVLWAGLVPKEVKGGSDQAPAQVNVQINF